MNEYEAKIVLSALNLYAKKRGYLNWTEYLRLAKPKESFAEFSEILIKKLKMKKKTSDLAGTND